MQEHGFCVREHLGNGQARLFFALLQDSKVTPILLSVRHTTLHRWRTPSTISSKVWGRPNVVDTRMAARHWTGIIESPDYAAHIWRSLLPDLGDRLLTQRGHDIAHVSELEHERILRAKAEAERDAMRSSTSWQMTAFMRQMVGWFRQR